MNTTLISVRLIQLRRELNLLGILYKILIALITVVVCVLFFMQFQKMQTAILAVTVFSLAIFSIQVSRKDKHFVLAQLSNSYSAVFTENLFFSIPLMVPVLFTAFWYLFFVMLLMVSLVPLIKINIKEKTTLRKLSSFIPMYYFEWVSGVRKNFVGLIILYAFAIGLCWVKIAPLVFLWLITLTITNFYIECEPLNILTMKNSSATKFLKQKMWSHTKLLGIYLIPGLILCTFMNPDNWLIHILFLLIQIPVLNFAIVLKYSVYEPNQNIQANAFVVAIAGFAGLIPFLLPLPLFMWVRNYFIAKRNLQSYL